MKIEKVLKWILVVFLIAVTLAGVGFIRHGIRTVDEGEKAISWIFGVFVMLIGTVPLSIVTLGDEKAEDLWKIIYSVALALICISFFVYIILTGLRFFL